MKISKRVKNAVILNLGLLVTSLGIVLFKTPNHFAIGGTSGISIIMAEIFPGLNVGTAMLILNVGLLLLGLIFLGKEFFKLTLYSSVAISVFVGLFEQLITTQLPLTDDLMLELIFATLIPSVGSAIVFNIGASTGGTDIVAMILKKYFKLDIGKALLIADLLITLWAGFVFGAKTGLYCILGLFARAFIMDLVIDNINSRKYVTIVTTHKDCILAFIINELHRSANVSTVKGGYSGKEKSMLTSVMTRRQALKLRDFLHENDPHAFITIVNSAQTLGNGFSAI